MMAKAGMAVDLETAIETGTAVETGADMEPTAAETGAEMEATAAVETGTEIEAESVMETVTSNQPNGACCVKTLSLTVGYKGGAFCGFARQPGRLTVQGSIEEALAIVFARPVLTVCAGRTDAGVHARGQVVSFEVDAIELRDKTLNSLQRSLQALTHDDISIKAVEERPDGFSARFDAVEREYHYHIYTGATPPLFMRDFCWHVGVQLDEDAMYEASRALIGEHDFKSFCTAASSKDKTTMRNVSRVDFAHETFFGEDILTIVVVGNAFLHSMVRTIVGSLVLVGKHHREPDFIQRALDACDRQAAGENAPAQGLVFWEVRY